MNQGHEATRTAQAMINLALMTGNIGRLGPVPIPLLANATLWAQGSSRIRQIYWLVMTF